MDIVFNTNGNEKQKQCARYWIDDITDEVVYGGSKGGGKSFLGTNLIFGDAFIYPGTHYFIARAKLNDLRKFTLPSIQETFEYWRINKDYYNFNGQDNLFTLYNDSKIFLLEAKYLPSDPMFERFGSMQMTRGWIEEAGQISEDAKNNLSASIGRWKNDQYGLHGKLLQTCNPAKNYLYNIYKLSRDGQLPDHVKFIQALPNDNKMLDKGYLDRLQKTLSKNQKLRLLHGNWEYDDDPAALCEFEKILEIFTNDFETLKGQKYITADIARYGSDSIKIGLWEGFRVKCFSFEKQSTTETSSFIDRIRREHGIPLGKVICDEDGVGGGVVDQLKCKGFVNNSRPLEGVDGKQENYENLQAQCAFKLANRINENGLYFESDDPKIKQDISEELEQLKQKNVDSDGKKGIVGKDIVKSMIGRSPDYRDMLLMREWFELKPNRSSGKFSTTFGSF